MLSSCCDYYIFNISGHAEAPRPLASHKSVPLKPLRLRICHAEKEDIVIINSPVGMPGRALNNSFIKKIAERGDDISGCFGCLKGCNPKVAPYCISKALINAVTGNIEKGLIFVGSNAYRVQKIVPVKELIAELKSEAELALDRRLSIEK